MYTYTAQLLHTQIYVIHIYSSAFIFLFSSTHQGVDGIPSLDTEHIYAKFFSR